MYKYIVSIIVPAYNVKNYLRETLDSIVCQKFDSYEVILIDDGSTDTTPMIINEYKERFPERIKVLRQQNQGVSAARNNGIDVAEGEYICFVDSDDVLDSEYLSVLYKGIKEANADIAICGFRVIDYAGKKMETYRNPVEWDVDFYGGYHYIFLDSVWAKIFRTGFIKNNNIRFSIGEHLEDSPFTIETNFLASEVVAIDYIGYYYRSNPSSIMGTINKKNSKPQMPYKGIENAIIKIRKNNKDKYLDVIFEYCILKMLAGFITVTCAAVDKQVRKELCNKCYYLIDKYFYNIKKNPFVKLKALKKLPIQHRIAVKLFVACYRFRSLYGYSLMASFLVRVGLRTCL